MAIHQDPPSLPRSRPPARPRSALGMSGRSPSMTPRKMVCPGPSQDCPASYTNAITNRRCSSRARPCCLWAPDGPRTNKTIKRRIRACPTSGVERLRRRVPIPSLAVSHTGRGVLCRAHQSTRRAHPTSCRARLRSTTALVPPFFFCFCRFARSPPPCSVGHVPISVALPRGPRGVEAVPREICASHSLAAAHR